VRALQIVIDSCTFETGASDVRYFIVSTLDDGSKDLVRILHLMDLDFIKKKD
jgi:hypothetical protein